MDHSILDQDLSWRSLSDNPQDSNRGGTFGKALEKGFFLVVEIPCGLDSGYSRVGDN
jgi:hypothetical protein